MSPSLVTLLSCTVTKLMGSKIHFLFLSPSNDLSRNSWMSKWIDITFREKSLRNGYFTKTKIFFLFRVWKNNGRDDLMTPTCFDAKSSRQQKLNRKRSVHENFTWYHFKPYIRTILNHTKCCWEVVENAWNFHVFFKIRSNLFSLSFTTKRLL